MTAAPGPGLDPAEAAAAERRPALMVKPGSFVLAFGTDAVLSFDLEGRLYAAFLRGRTFRRGLGGTVLEKGRSPGAGRGQRWCRPLDAGDRRALYGTVRALAEAALAAVRRGDARVTGGGRERARTLLERAAAWTPERLERERERFRAVYGRVGVIPPDQYLAVVVQATQGCAWNRCTFCAFYRGQTFRIRSPEEFRAHCRAVRDLLGEGLSLRRSVFLGEASAMTVPFPRLAGFLDIVREEFPAQREVHTFMDLFTARKSADELAALAARGLRRVVIGLETGCDPLLALVRKPATAAQALAAVRSLKTAGISVALVVLLGLGGPAWWAAHVRDTAAVLNAMGLGAGDIIYFSPLTEQPDAEYFREARARGLRPLTAGEMREQEAAIRALLHFRDGRPALARYDIRELIY